MVGDGQKSDSAIVVQKEELPYVMGLVRQTLEHWLSNGDFHD